MLFFLPFEHRELEFNNRLLFIIGLGIIPFITMLLFRIMLPSWLKRLIRLESFKISNEVVLVVLIWIFNTLGYSFYIRYVGMEELSLFSILRILLIASVPSIILKLADVNKTLRDQLKHFVEKNIRLEKIAAEVEESERKPELFHSDSQADRIEIHPDDIMLVRSADNYINIVYREDETVRQKMLRKTITNIGSQLKKYPEFLRCHRTCIINTMFIVNLTNNYKGYRLKLLGYEDEIPVSRQYILALKNYLDRE